MRIIALRTLREFWELHPDAQAALKTWYTKIEKSTYANPQEVIKVFKDADTASEGRIIFNIARNKYRLVAAFRYDKQICWIKFIGSHKEYDTLKL